MTVIKEIFRSQTRKVIITHRDLFRPLFLFTVSPTLWPKFSRGVTFHSLGTPFDVTSVTEDVHLYFLLRPVPEDVNAMLPVLNALYASGHRRQSVFFIPHRSLAVDLLLEGDGSSPASSAKFAVLEVGPIPIDDDVALIPAAKSFYNAFVAPLPLNTVPISRALAIHASLTGWPRSIIAKGAVAGAIAVQLKSLRPSEDAAALSGADDVMIIIDRTSDPVSLLVPQGTYDGVLDELLGLSVRSMVLPETVAAAAEFKPKPPQGDAGSFLAEESAQPTEIATGTPAHAALRDLSWYGARVRLADIRSDVVNTLRGLGEAVGVVRQGTGTAPLRDLTRRTRDALSRETDVRVHSELYTWAASQVDRRDKTTRMYQTLLAADATADAAVADCVRMLSEGGRFTDVVRLMCVTSHTVPLSPQQSETLKTELVNEYGPLALVAVSTLVHAGLYRDPCTAAPHVLAVEPKKDDDFAGGVRRLLGRAVDTVKRAFVPRYGRLAEALRLFDGDCDPFNPKDIHFVNWGYAPISARFVGEIVAHGPAHAAETTEYMAGDFSNVEVEKGPPPRPSARRTITVVFVGGVTRSELAALRWLSASETFRTPAGEQSRLCILTTSITTAQRVLVETLRDIKGLRL